MKSRQYTIRSVPPHVDRALRQRAKKENKSLNHVVLEVLEQALEAEAKPKTYHDLDYLAGTWVDDPEFDKAMKEFDRIDEEMWK